MHQTVESFEKGLLAERREHRAFDDLRLRRACRKAFRSPMALRT